MKILHKLIVYYAVHILITIIASHLRMNISEHLFWFSIFSIMEHLLLPMSYKMHYLLAEEKKIEFETKAWKKYGRLSQESKEKDTVGSFQKKLERASYTTSTMYSWGIPVLFNLFLSIVGFIYVLIIKDQIILLLIFITVNILWYLIFSQKQIENLDSIRQRNRKKMNKNMDLLELYIHRFHNQNICIEKILDLSKELGRINFEYFNTRDWISTVQQIPNFLVVMVIPLIDKELIPAVFMVFISIRSALNGATNYMNQWKTMENDKIYFENFWKNKKFIKKPKQKNIPSQIILCTDIPNLFFGFAIYIKQGQKIRINGPSGCGKTSLIRAMIGHSNGAVYSSSDDPLAYIDRISYMRQNIRDHTPTSKTTIRQLFHSTKINTDIIKECIRIVKLNNWFVKVMEEKLDCPINGLISGGEKTRLCLAITIYHAMINKSQWIILDEPEQGIDPELAPGMLQEIFNKFSQTTIFIITHMCDCQIKQLGINTKWNIIGKEIKVELI